VSKHRRGDLPYYDIDVNPAQVPSQRHATGVEVDAIEVQPRWPDSFHGPRVFQSKILMRAAKRVEYSFSSLEGKIVAAPERT
jgi:hypothetical protein